MYVFGTSNKFTESELPTGWPQKINPPSKKQEIGTKMPKTWLENTLERDFLRQCSTQDLLKTAHFNHH